MSEDTTNVAQAVLDADRLKRAIDLRVRGAHWGEIARECGYPSPAAAFRAVSDAAARATQRAEETADSYRDLANLRLESLMRTTLSILGEDAPVDLDGNVPDDRAVRLRAVDEARRLVESIVKLNGVKPPAGDGDSTLKVQLVGIDPEDLV